MNGFTPEEEAEATEYFIRLINAFTEVWTRGPDEANPRHLARRIDLTVRCQKGDELGNVYPTEHGRVLVPIYKHLEWGHRAGGRPNVGRMTEKPTGQKKVVRILDEHSCGADEVPDAFVAAQKAGLALAWHRVWFRVCLGGG
jgi:hypothetical protein